MKSFGIGLALLVTGFATYMVSAIVKNIATLTTNLAEFLQQLEQAGAFPEGVTLPADLGTLSFGVPQDILNIVTYVAIGVMAFGVGWFWIIEPILHLSAPPPKKAATTPPPVATRVSEPQPSTMRGKSLEQWVQEAIQEKIDREKGRQA